jgi:two-component system response regulator HydG
VRIVAATNRDLETEARGGRFRTDLYYRLNVVHIVLPPLRARAEDIGVLVDHFLERYSRQYQVAPKRIGADAMERLRRHPWPGNVRELQNVIERAFALSVADTVTVDDLPPALHAAPADDGPAPGEVPTLEESERRVIAAALRKSGGNKNEAARLLGIDRQRLYRKLEKYRLG